VRFRIKLTWVTAALGQAPVRAQNAFRRRADVDEKTISRAWGYRVAVKQLQGRGADAKQRDSPRKETQGAWVAGFLANLILGERHLRKDSRTAN